MATSFRSSDADNVFSSQKSERLAVRDLDRAADVAYVLPVHLDAELVEDRRDQVGHLDRVVLDEHAVLVGGAPDAAALNARARYLARSGKEAARIFGEIGIQTLWIDCPIDPAGPGDLPKCSKARGPANLVLRIVPGSPVHLGLAESSLGFALESGLDGTHAGIFYQRVEEIVQEEKISRPQLLGYAIAHEIGHLLLGTNSHSAEGMMRPRWDRVDLKRAALELLRFTPNEAAIMREAVSARIKRQSVKGTYEAFAGKPAGNNANK